MIKSLKDLLDKFSRFTNSLVSDPKPYEWYRAKIEDFIFSVLLDELYK